MKTYDFRKGKRGPVLSLPPGKERITIRLDSDILEYFRDAVERAGGGNYQTLINNALRAYIEGGREACPRGNAAARDPRGVANGAVKGREIFD
jgi:hypothetical protein